MNAVTLLLVVAGALNWGLMGLFQVDLVATLFAGPQTALSRILYLLVGLAGLCQLVPLADALSRPGKRKGGIDGDAYDRSGYGPAGYDPDGRG